MAVNDTYVFPGFLTPVLTQLFFPKPPTTFLTCFCRDERRKYAGKKSRLNRGSNSQPLGHESDTLTFYPSQIKFHFWSFSCSVGCKILMPLTLSQTRNSRLFQTENFQITILNVMKMAESSLKG